MAVDPRAMFIGSDPSEDPIFGSGFGNFFAGALGQPLTPAIAPGAGLTPSTTTRETQFPSIPDFGLPDIEQITNLINNLQQSNFQNQARNRIPGQAGLEQASSARIQQLLNPPAFYPEVDRRSAEQAGFLGLPGEAPASESRNTRMTREEQLRDIGLGQQFLTGALARNPIGPQFDPSGLVSYMTQLPGQRAQLLTQQQQFAQSQAQQRELALAQMENAFRLAQLQALRGGRALGGGPSYGYRGFPQAGTSGTGGSTPRLPGIPEPRPQGAGQLTVTSPSNLDQAVNALGESIQNPSFYDWNQPFYQPLDWSIPDVVQPFYDPESADYMYA